MRRRLSPLESRLSVIVFYQRVLSLQMLGVTEGEVRNLINERVISLQLKRATERERASQRKHL